MLEKYSPNEIENKRGKLREEKGYFRATTDAEKANFGILIPPPNVTGQEPTTQESLLRIR